MRNQDLKNNEPRNFFAEWNEREKNDGFTTTKRDLPAFAVDTITKGLDLIRYSSR